MEEGDKYEISYFVIIHTNNSQNIWINYTRVVCMFTAIYNSNSNKSVTSSVSNSHVGDSKHLQQISY